jgi:hypothetical protein
MNLAENFKEGFLSVKANMLRSVFTKCNCIGNCAFCIVFEVLFLAIVVIRGIAQSFSILNGEDRADGQGEFLISIHSRRNKLHSHFITLR